MTAWLGAAVTGLATATTLIVEPRSRRRARAAKMVAASGFIVLALSVGALDSTYGTIILVGLALSWIGDLLLTYSSQRAFLFGLVSFLFGHLAYVIAFAARGVDGIGAGIGAIATIVTAAVVVPWVLPHVTTEMRVPVLAYITVISVMVVAATATTGYDTDWRIIVGAALFYASDVFVARDRFIAPGVVNRWIGLPLYFGGQLLLAWSAGG